MDAAAYATDITQVKLFYCASRPIPVTGGGTLL